MNRRIALLLVSLVFSCADWSTVSVASHADASTAAGKVISVQVVDVAGDPVPGVEVSRSVWTDQPDFDRNEKFETSANGLAEVTVPETMRILRLWVRKEGQATLFANWSGPAIDSVPPAIRVVIPSATTIGGIVVDSAGEPIADARIEVRVDDAAAPLNAETPFRYSAWLATGEEAARTDDRGRWSLANVPPGDDLKLQLRIRHPDYIQDKYYGELASKNGVTTEQLRDQTARIVMPSGEVVRGQVTDAAGVPVPQARISWSRESRWMIDDLVMTDEDGQYKLPPLPVGTLYLAIAADKQKPLIKQLDIVADMAPVDVAMEAGHELVLRVVDDDGNPVPDARVLIEQWGGVTSGIIGAQAKLFDGTTPGRTNDEGVFAWLAAPDDAVRLRLLKKGFSGHEGEFVASSDAQQITLHSEVVVSGAIVDEETSQPVSPVMMMPVTYYPRRPDDPIVQRSQIRTVEGGRFTHTNSFWSEGQELVLQFEAPGYRPQRVGPFGPAAGAVSVDVRLQRAAPLRGRVLGIDGQPAAGAVVSFTTKDTSLIVSDWTYDRDGLSTRTDDQGRFQFTATLHPPVVIATHPSGYAEVALQLDKQPGDLQLRPWSRVEGCLMRNDKPIVGERIYLRPIRMLGGDNPHVQDSFSTVTGQSGQFSFDRVPPVPSYLQPYVTVWRESQLASAQSVPLDLQPGETRDVQLGQQGIVVRGRVRPAGQLAAKLDMNYCLNYLLKRAPGIEPPAPIARASFDWRDGWSFDFVDSQEGRAFLSTLPHHFVKLQSDGAFAVHGVTPGDYQLAISIYEPPEGCLIDPVGRSVFDLTVAEADIERGELDVGDIEVDVKLGPQVGDPFPDFRFEGLAADEVHSIADWRGRYVLVDVWATWCGPCIAALPELASVAKGLDPDRATVLSICLDEQLEQAKSFIKARQMNWPQGLLGERDNPLVRQQLGISSVPAYFVLDPTGNLVHRSFRLADAVAALESALQDAPPAP